MNKNIFSEERLDTVTISRYVKCDVQALKKLERANLSAHAVGVYYVLSLKVLIHSNISEVSISDLVRYSKSSKSTVIRCLKELEREGFITTNKNKGRQTFYQLSFSFNGRIEKKKDRPTGVTQTPTSVTQTPVPTIYINKRTKKRNTSYLQKKDDVFFGDKKNQSMDKNKLSLCKRYMSHLKELNLIQIKTTEAQYLASIYRKNDEVDTWENLKTKTAELAEKIEVKTNTPKQEWVELGMGQKLKTTDQKPKENTELARLKKSRSYKHDFEKIFLELRSQNPMLKPGFFADKLVHAEMLARVAEHA